MALLVAVAGRGPAFLGQYDEVWGRDVLRTFDHAMDVVTMCLVLLSDDEHRQLCAVTLEACAKALGVQDVGEVAKVLLGQRIRDPLTIDHLALGKGNVHRVRDSVFEVIGIEVGGREHQGVWDLLLSHTIYRIFIF